MTACPLAKKLTNMPSLWWMWPAATRRLSLWLARAQQRSPLPCLASTDGGLWSGPSFFRLTLRQFMGTVNQLLAKQGQARSSRCTQGPKNYRTLEPHLGWETIWASAGTAEELLMNPDERSLEWVKRLPVVTAALNDEVTWLTGKKPVDAIRQEHVPQNTSSVVPGRLVGLEAVKLHSSIGVRYMYQSGELEGGRRRATDPIWSLQVYSLGRSVTQALSSSSMYAFISAALLAGHLCP